MGPESISGMISGIVKVADAGVDYFLCKVQINDMTLCSSVAFGSIMTWNYCYKPVDNYFPMMIIIINIPVIQHQTLNVEICLMMMMMMRINDEIYLLIKEEYG